MGKHKNYNIDLIKQYWETTCLTINQISNEINISSDMLRYYIKKYNFIRPDNLKLQEIENTKNRRKTTRLQNYDGNYFSDDSIIKMKQTRYEKNDGNYFGEDTISKRKHTNLNKYGVENVFQCENIITKCKDTKLKKYGDENYNNREKAIATRLDNFDTYLTEEMLNKSKQTSLNKYGKEFYTQTDEYKTRAKITRHKNNDGAYFSKNTINKLKLIAKENYRKSKEKRLQTIQDKYSSFKIPFYKGNDKMQYILQNPKNNLENYILGLDKNNRNFAYIEEDLSISYTTLLNLLHLYDLKDLLINTRSHFQQNVISFIKSLNVNYVENCRDIIAPQEIDIYLPEYKLGIECNGNYWHSSQNKIDKNYHYSKSKLCEERGIRLIHIFEYEWNSDRQRPILKNIIKNAIGINENKVYARKLNIEIRKSAEMKEFFEKNNIQGFRGGKFAICLTDKITKEIYMAYMMGSAFFGKGKYEWEVIRGATKLGYTVVGGASKIFSYFVKNYNPKNCVYYIDYNYFNGNSLKNLPKMKFIKTQPSFKNFWKKTGEVKNREPQRNAEIKELYKNGEVLQIYNAGTKVYVWDVNS